MHFALPVGLGPVWLVSIAIMLPANFSPAQAARPAMAFDFPRSIVVESHPLTDDPEHQIVSCAIPISVRLLAGDISEVQEIRIEIGDCDRRLQVHGFSPTTRLESVLSGDVEWSKTTETTKQFSAALGGEAPVFFGDAVARITPTANGGVANREVITERQQRLAPKHVAVVAGTTREGSGVFFTLRPTPQTSLEGMHRVTVEFVTPHNWRGDALHVSVSAAGEEKFLWMSQPKVWAAKKSSVAIYVAGDPEARQAASTFVRQ